MIAHAKLSASGSARWLACPGSVKAEEGFPNTSSKFADEGSLAHALADLVLSHDHDPRQYIGQSIDGSACAVTPDMVEFVEGYASYVRSFGGEQFYEVRLDLSHVVRDSFGTADAIAINGGTLHVIDLKYGKGVQVDAENNTQAMLYALGALEAYGFLHDIGEVVLHIYQPRIAHFSQWSLSVPDLLAWADWVRERVALTEQRDAPRIPTEKGCQWCKAKHSCKALADFTSEIIIADFDNLEPCDLETPETMTHEQIARVMSAKKLILGWLDAVENHITHAIERGDKFPGWKMVEGRSVRQWSDESAAAAALLSVADESDIYTRKLISPTQAVKLLGKVKADAIADYIIKPPGRPALAPDSDKRPSIDDASDDFACID